jgi:hypothetical protein
MFRRLAGIALAGACFSFGGSFPTRAAEDFWPYRVEAGDTLIGIRDRLMVPGADWQTLQRINQVPNPRQLVPGSTLQIPVNLLRQQALAAEVVHSYGEVQVQRSGGAPQPLVGGQTLASGDVVRTGAQSSAVLRFADGARVMMRPDSVLKIERTVKLGGSDVVDTQLRLESGSVDSRVPKLKDPQKAPRFEIRTPLANLGVRGTEFRTTATPTQSSVEVLEGRVVGAAAAAVAKPNAASAKPGSAQAIDAGFGTLASPSGVEPPRLLLAAPDLKALPAKVERLPVQLPWGPSPGAAAYRAQVFSAESAEPLLLSGVFNATSARWSDDLPDGRYVLRVRAIDNAGLEGLDGTAAFTLKARPEPPFSTQPPANERVAGEDLLFSWTRNPAAIRYRLQVADTPDFASPRVDEANLTATEVRLSLPVGTHYWRLASIRDNAGVPDMGPWGDARSFTRVAPPAVPVSQAPRITPEGVWLAWNPGSATRFQLQVASDAAFSNILHDEKVDGSQWLFRKPESGRYHVRVRALDAAGVMGPYGQTQVVEVEPSTKWWWFLLPALVILI